MAENPRYDGKPLLRLIECYVLHVIGELPPADEDKLKAMAPNLRKTYRTEGEWHEVVAHALKFPPTTPKAIQMLWQESSGRARANGAPLPPQMFAEMFADSSTTN